jgi:hypothetical protein
MGIQANFARVHRAVESNLPIDAVHGLQSTQGFGEINSRPERRTVRANRFVVNRDVEKLLEQRTGAGRSTTVRTDEPDSLKVDAVSHYRAPPRSSAIETRHT